jgi:hypothetical protein
MWIVGLALLLTVAVLAPVAWWVADGQAIKALMVAGITCGGAALVTWRGATRWEGLQGVQFYVALGFLVRSGVPLSVVTVLCWQDRAWIQAGLIWWTLVIYEVLLLVETWMMVRRHSGDA